jgi:heme-binding NEAT domain protein
VIPDRAFEPFHSYHIEYRFDGERFVLAQSSAAAKRQFEACLEVPPPVDAGSKPAAPPTQPDCSPPLPTGAPSR